MMTGFERPEGDRLLTLSDIMPQEVFGLNLIKNYGEKLYSNVTESWIKYHLLLRVSRLRIGRKEIILMLTGISQAKEKSGKKGIGELFSGLK